jgi:ketosteroid isomerase-like protein
MSGLSVVLIIATLTAHAEKPMSTFEKLYAEMKEAMNRRDTKAVAGLLAPEFVSEDVSGKIETAQQMLSELSALPPQDPNKQSQTTLLSVKVVGNVASVTQRYHMTTTKIALGGGTKLVELNAVSVDTWKQIQGSWLQARTVTQQMDYLVNGRSVVHKIHDQK